MKITLDIPDTSVCAVISCVYVDEIGNNTIAMYTAGAEELRSGEEIIIPASEEKALEGK